jgi:WD40 repeat protein
MKNLTEKSVLKTLVLIFLVGTIACGKMINNQEEETSISTNNAAYSSLTFQTPTRTALPTPTSTKTWAPFVPLPTVQVQQNHLALAPDNANRIIRLGRFGTGAPNTLAYSPDGKYLAVGTSQGVFFFDAQTFQQIRFLDLNSYVEQIAFSPDGKKILLAIPYGGYTQIGLWNVETGQMLMDVKNDGEKLIVLKIALSSRGFITATSTEPYGKTLNRVWAVATGRLISETESEYYGYKGAFIGFSLDGNTLYFPGNENNALNLQTNEFQEIDPGLISSVLDVVRGNTVHDNDTGTDSAISIDGKYKASFLYYETDVRIIDLQTNKQVVTLPFDTIEAFTVAQSSQNGVETYVAITTDENGQIFIWDLFTGNKILTSELLSELLEEGYNLAISPDEQTLAVRMSGEIWLMSIDRLEIINKYQIDLYDDIRFSKDGGKLFITSYEGSGEINLINGEVVSYPLKTMDYYTREIGFFDIRTSEYYDISMDQDLSEYLLNNISKNKSVSFPLVPGYQSSFFIDAIAISPDGKYLAAGLAESPIVIWDIQTRQQVALLTGHQRMDTDVQYISIQKLEFSPWSNLLVSVGNDGSTRLWDIQSGKQLALLNVCCEAQFSPDGRILVTAGNGVIRVWGIPPWP